jgi:hypothetical protein
MTQSASGAADAIRDGLVEDTVVPGRALPARARGRRCVSCAGGYQRRPSSRDGHLDPRRPRSLAPARVAHPRVRGAHRHRGRRAADRVRRQRQLSRGTVRPARRAARRARGRPVETVHPPCGRARAGFRSHGQAAWCGRRRAAYSKDMDVAVVNPRGRDTEQQAPASTRSSTPRGGGERARPCLVLDEVVELLRFARGRREQELAEPGGRQAPSPRTRGPASARRGLGSHVTATTRRSAPSRTTPRYPGQARSAWIQTLVFARGYGVVEIA